MSDRRVVITGIGLVTPAGTTREASWAGLCSGQSRTGWIPQAAGAAPLLGACVPADADRDPSAEPLGDLAQWAAAEALADARLTIDAANRDRIGCVLGTSKGGWQAFQRAWHTTYRQHSPGEGIDPFALYLPDTPARQVAQRFDLRGPCLCPVAACATGLISLSRGADLVAQGRCDAVLAGSTDASVTEIVQASFRRLGVLARDTADPSRACRPFDQQRSGFVVGEGAAVLVLEREDLARARGATIYATWLASGLGSEATHLARLNEDPTDLARLISATLTEAGVSPAEIDYVNYHGTGTRQNDRLETAAIRRVFGDEASRVAGSSLKGTIGHLLGAAGSVELAATVLALRDGIIPPTVNLEHPDPECDLDYTPGTSRARPLRTALKLSLGFGGHLVCAVLRRGA